MLKKILRTAMTICATALFLGFWALAITGHLPSPTTPSYHQTDDHPAHGTSKSTIEELSAERVGIYTEALAYLTFMLVVVACFQLRLLFKSDEATAKALKIAGEQNTLAAQQSKILDKQTDISRNELRAYVKLSHLSPPGLLGPSEDGTFIPDSKVRVQIEARNYGRTPAKITAVRLQCSPLEVLPERPNYTEAEKVTEQINGFVVADDKIIHTRWWKLPSTIASEINSGKKDLYVIGYVDYIDAFGQRHRGGYARKYDRTVHFEAAQTTIARATRNNLVFVTGHDGFNYDRPRVPGEGDDWNDPKE